MVTEADVEARAKAIAATAPEPVSAVTARDCGFVAAYFALFGGGIFTLRQLMTTPFPKGIADRFAAADARLDDAAALRWRLAAHEFLQAAPDHRSFALTGDGRKLGILLGVASPQQLDRQL